MAVAAATLRYVCVLILLNLIHTATASSAKLKTSWKNNQGSGLSYYDFVDGSHLRAIIVRDSVTRNYPKFGFGFFRNSSNESIFYLAIVRFIERTSPSPEYHNHPPVILWFANGTPPVKENATLKFAADGDLILEKEDGTRVWSTETTGKHVTSMILDGDGSLRMEDSKGKSHWVSSNHPTHTWLPRYPLHVHAKLYSTSSLTNLSRGKYFITLSVGAILVFQNTSTAKKFQTIPYRSVFPYGIVFHRVGNHVTYDAPGSTFHYMRLEPNGHLNLYQIDNGFSENVDISRDKDFGDCIYPSKCGNYGVCFNDECNCPGGSVYFKQSNGSENGFTCEEVTPLSCQYKHLHKYLMLTNVTYFDFVPYLINVDVETCRTACLDNCSCKAALFRYREARLIGNCSLPTEVYTLRKSNKSISGYKDLAFIKVQMVSDDLKFSLLFMLLSSGSAFMLVTIGASVYLYKKWWEGRRRDCITDECSVHVASHLVQFSSEGMKSATRDFQVKLGRGGSGSVFEGFLDDGTKIAVKRLYPGENRGRKEFLSEVETIGKVHHFNLVRLVGYCAERSNRLLVYEYMCNGSLDKWIYEKNRKQALTWDTRKRIIVQIARGLEYLHDYCNPKIIHFDIKPQNILLDRNLDVKISDFGLARLIDQDQSHVSTMPKGTPGYMAPELTRGNNVTAKIDIYSFGVLMLEIICGRRSSNPKTGDYLIDSLRIKAEADRLSDLVDQHSEDMQRHLDEAVKLINIAISCLQINLFRRPSASDLVKILEGSSNFEPITDHSFLNFAVAETRRESKSIRSSTVLASTLSGPR